MKISNELEKESATEEHEGERSHKYTKRCQMMSTQSSNNNNNKKLKKKLQNHIASIPNGYGWRDRFHKSRSKECFSKGKRTCVQMVFWLCSTEDHFVNSIHAECYFHPNTQFDSFSHYVCFCSFLHSRPLRKWLSLVPLPFWYLMIVS